MVDMRKRRAEVKAKEARDVLIGNGRPGSGGGEGGTVEGTTSQAVSCGEGGERGGWPIPLSD